MCSPFSVYFVCYCYFGKQSKRSGAQRNFRTIANTRGNSGVAAKCKGGFATPMMELIPALLFAQLADVRGVVTAVPRVKEEQPIHILQAGFRMAERPRVLLRRDGSQQTNPAVVEGIQKFERNFDRCVLGIIEHGPISLLVRLDRRFSFGQRQPQPAVGVPEARRLPAAAMLQSSPCAIWTLYLQPGFPNLSDGAFSNAQCGNYRQRMCRPDRGDIHGAG